MYLTFSKVDNKRTKLNKFIRSTAAESNVQDGDC